MTKLRIVASLFTCLNTTKRMMAGSKTQNQTYNYWCFRDLLHTLPYHILSRDITIFSQYFRSYDQIWFSGFSIFCQPHFWTDWSVNFVFFSSKPNLFVTFFSILIEPACALLVREYWICILACPTRTNAWICTYMCRGAF